MQKEYKYIRYFMIFVVPVLVAYCIAVIIPFFMGVVLSFCKFNTLKSATFVGLSNYKTLFNTNSTFIKAFLFTVKFAVVGVVTTNIIAFFLAMLLTRGIPGSNAFRTVFFMPNLIGGLVLGYIWQLLLNGILIKLFGVDITFSGVYGYWGLVILYNWQYVGYLMIIYIAGIQNIPGELIEASKVDGASAWQRLKNIVIPMVMSSITICLFLTLTNCFKMYDQNLALTAGAPGKDTAMIALDIFDTFYTRTGFKGVGQAEAVLFFIIVATISLIQLTISKHREANND